MFVFQGSMIEQTGAWFLGVRYCNSFISAFHVVKTKGPICSGYKHPENWDEWPSIWQSRQTFHPMRNEGNTTLGPEAVQKNNLSQYWQQAWKGILKCGKKFFTNFLICLTALDVCQESTLNNSLSCPLTQESFCSLKRQIQKWARLTGENGHHKPSDKTNLMGQLICLYY